MEVEQTAGSEADAKKRFATLDSTDIDKLLEGKDSASTKRATQTGVRIFRSYLKEKCLPTDFENLSHIDLDSILSTFYAEARQENGELYKSSSLNSIRYSINRHLEDMDIITGKSFKKSNDVFIAATKELKRRGKDVTHHPPLEKKDFAKLYQYFDLNNNIKLQQKVFVDVLLYFGRRARSNIQQLKITDFVITVDNENNTYIQMTTDEQMKHQPDVSNRKMYAIPGMSYLKLIFTSRGSPQDFFKEHIFMRQVLLTCASHIPHKH